MVHSNELPRWAGLSEFPRNYELRNKDKTSFERNVDIRLDINDNISISGISNFLQTPGLIEERTLPDTKASEKREKTRKTCT